MRVPILNQVTLIGCLATAGRRHESGMAVEVQLPRRDDRGNLQVTCIAGGSIAATLGEKGHIGAVVLISGALNVDREQRLHVRISPHFSRC